MCNADFNCSLIAGYKGLYQDTWKGPNQLSKVYSNNAMFGAKAEFKNFEAKA
ncbi:MAG: hypothetical protein MJ237_03345 [bacterium]|nr:hypothetical protein [bacterium]